MKAEILNALLNNKQVSIMKKFFFITIIMAILALSGCVRHCSEFPAKMQQTYFPYTSGQALTFVSNEGDSLSLNVTRVSLSGPYNLEFGVKEACSPEMTVDMTGDIKHIKHEISFLVRWGTISDYDGMWIPEYNNPYYSRVFVQEDTIVEGWASFPYYDFFLINGVYDGAIRSLLDTLYFANYENYPDRIIDTLVVVKDRGLAGISTSDGRKYVLTE